MSYIKLTRDQIAARVAQDIGWCLCQPGYWPADQDCQLPARRQGCIPALGKRPAGLWSATGSG